MKNINLHVEIILQKDNIKILKQFVINISKKRREKTRKKKERNSEYKYKGK